MKIQKNPKIEEHGIKVTKGMEKIIDEKVNRMLHPPEEEQEPKKEQLDLMHSKDKEKSENEKPKDLLEASIEEEERKIKNRRNKV